MGTSLVGYNISRILKFPMEELVYLRFAGVFNTEGNEIYEGPHEVTSRGRHNRRRIMRYHCYLCTPQQLEEDKLPGIIFIQMLTGQEAMILPESHHRGEGQLCWDTTWGTSHAPDIRPRPRSFQMVATLAS